MKRDLGSLASRTHDVLVVGGGIHGAALAWEAAHRGLRVALVEARDFGSGTSWNSLKTIHGGLRHLQRADLAAVRESARERRALLRIAPALVRPLPVLVPVYGHGRKGREALWCGLIAADVLTWDLHRGLREQQRVPRGRMLSAAEVSRRIPGIGQRGLSGGALWSDAQVVSSERLVLAFLHAASSAGAALANYARVLELRRADSAVTGAVVRDEVSGQTCDVAATVTVVAAAGATAEIARSARLSMPRVPFLRGFNAVLRRAVTDTHAVGGRTDGRYLFLAPWQGHSILGTAYAPLETPAADGVAALLAGARAAFPWAALRPGDVALVHEGEVLGRDADHLASRPVVVDHASTEGVRGVVSVVGVKLTTARAVAASVVDLIASSFPGRVQASRSETEALPCASLLTGPLAERARHAVREEQALHLADAVLRRLDLGTAGPPPPADVDVVAAAMAGELRWDGARAERERADLAAFYASGRSPANTMAGQR